MILKLTLIGAVYKIYTWPFIMPILYFSEIIFIFYIN